MDKLLDSTNVHPLGKCPHTSLLSDFLPPWGEKKFYRVYNSTFCCRKYFKKRHRPALNPATLCPGGLAGHALEGQGWPVLISWRLSDSELQNPSAQLTKVPLEGRYLSWPFVVHIRQTHTLLPLSKEPSQAAP